MTKQDTAEYISFARGVDGDPLTGLPGRHWLESCCFELIADHRPFVLVVVDVEALKAINGAHGYALGDAVLQALAARFATLGRGHSLVARGESDEFLLALPHPGGSQATGELLAGISHCARAPVEYGARSVEPRIRAGAAHFPTHAGSLTDLSTKARLALKGAKASPARRTLVFHPVLGGEVARRRAIREEIRLAQENGEWLLHFERQLDLESRRMAGAEALLRWRHPQRGLLKAASFIDAVEAHPLAGAVSAFVLEETCRSMAEWRRRGTELGRVAVNVFGAQLRSGRLERDVKNALERHALDPACLELEITERTSLSPRDPAWGELRRLQEGGVSLAIDDFGTGTAGLGLLQAMPFNRLKIDRSFVVGARTSLASAAIVGGVALIGRQLGMSVLAEGVESWSEADRLRKLGCVEAQGFLFGDPLVAPPSLRLMA